MSVRDCIAALTLSQANASRSSWCECGSASLENLKTQLAAVTEVYDKLQAAAEQVTTLRDQFTQLAQDKDSALAQAASAQNMVDKLKSELQGQIQKVTSLQEQSKKLRQAIEELKKLGSAIKIPEVTAP